MFSYLNKFELTFSKSGLMVSLNIKVQIVVFYNHIELNIHDLLIQHISRTLLLLT